MAEPEKVYMPESANFYCWVDKEQSGCGYWHIPFPSGSEPGAAWTVSINIETRLMSCDCPGFRYTGICSHIKRLVWITKKKSKDPKAVSLEARLSLSKEQIEGDERKILNELKAYPLTCDELEVKLNMLHQTAAARINGLYKAGWLEDSGDRRPTRSGSKAIVWQIT